MPRSDVDVVVVGGGAAGVAAARRLHEAAIDCLIVEARPRLGGRAWTVTDSGFALDLGCGWLHSADRNPWVKIAQEQGAEIDKSRAPWARRTSGIGFPRAEQQDFQEAMDAFFARLEGRGESDDDVPAGNFLEPGNRWNGLINALSTYISGAEWDASRRRISTAITTPASTGAWSKAMGR